ncbi:hypothetical protein ACFW1A_29995 [Kitasatospora sp. NPDC058965]|uniref:hypothetical protein n=1 Tax=Kitasatospora sp. NPDC058965 TaxID=3346682 RepID=UPI0036A6E479
MDIEDVLHYLVEHRAPNLPPGYLSEQLLALSWILDDEGAGIFEVGRRWLESGDEFRVAVALGLNEAFMADSWVELVGLADSVKKKVPSLAADVDVWLENSRPSYLRLEERRGHGARDEVLRADGAD